MKPKIKIAIALSTDTTEDLERGSARIVLSAEGKKDIYITIDLLQIPHPMILIKEGKETILAVDTRIPFSPLNAKMLPKRECFIAKNAVGALFRLFQERMVTVITEAASVNYMIAGQNYTSIPLEYDIGTHEEEIKIVFGSN